MPKRWVAVTGATGGIGRLLLPRLQRQGFSVVACGRRAVSGLNFVPFDLEQPDTAAATGGGIATLTGGALAGLVNLGGVIVQGPLELVPVAEFARQFAVNVTAPFALTRALLPQLRAAKGRVINIGAVSSRMTAPLFGPIAASKAALASLSDAMRMEFSTFGIDVVLIEPGALKTEIFATAGKAQTAAMERNPPDINMLYRAAIPAWAKAMSSSAADDPDVVAKAIVEALTTRKPKTRMTVGKGASSFVWLSHLPDRIRDCVLLNFTGYAKAMRRR